MRGMRVEPPTSRMRSSWLGRTFASVSAVVTARMVRASILPRHARTPRGRSRTRGVGLAVHGGDVVLLHQGEGLGGELDLGRLSRPPQPGLQEAVLARLPADARLRLQPGVEPLHEERVEVVAAEPVVSGGGQHLDHAASTPTTDTSKVPPPRS